MRRVALLTLTATFALAVGCKREGTAPPVQARATMADSAEQVMFNVRFLLTKDGIQRGELFADSVYIFDENTRFELRKVRTVFNTASGAKDGVMSADRGRYSIRMQMLEGYGNVKIVTNDGRRLSSPQLRFSQAMNEVSSDSAYTFVRPGQTLSGIGFKTDPQLTRFQGFGGGKSRGSVTLPSQ